MGMPIQPYLNKLVTRLVGVTRSLLCLIHRGSDSLLTTHSRGWLFSSNYRDVLPAVVVPGLANVVCMCLSSLNRGGLRYMFKVFVESEATGMYS